MDDPTARLEESVERLEAVLRGNPERLSVPLLNRTLHALARGQLAILERLSRIERTGLRTLGASQEAAGTGEVEEEPTGPPPGEASAAPEPGEPDEIEIRVGGAGEEASPDVDAPDDDGDEEDGTAPEEEESGATERGTVSPEAAEALREALEAIADEVGESLGKRIRLLTGEENELAVETFGVENLRRWIDQEQGSLFQMRGELAFVDLQRMTWTSYEELRQNLSTLGYPELVGLVDPGFRARVLLFRK